MSFVITLFIKCHAFLRRIITAYYIRYNRFIFKIQNVQYGKDLKVFNKFYLHKKKSSTIKIGDNLVYTNGDAINPLCRNIRGCINAENNATIEIGNNVGISSACIWAEKYIKIGNNVNIGGDCILIDTDAHNLDYELRRNPSTDSTFAISAPIIIEDDVMIGTRCIVLKGVTIGARSVIGAGSIVTKDIPSDCVAAGNPCRVIRYFAEEN